MNTSDLVREMNAQKAALTTTAKANAYDQARRQWLALGGSEKGFVRVDAGQFVMLNETEQRHLIETLKAGDINL